MSGLRFFNRSVSGVDGCDSGLAVVESGLAKERVAGIANSLRAGCAMHRVDCMIAIS